MPCYRNLFLASACFAAGASPLIPHLLAAPAPPDSPVQLERVDVTTTPLTSPQFTLQESAGGASRLSLTSLATPAAISVIASDVLAARGDRTLVEAVTRAAGFTNLGAPGNGGTSLGARGFTGHGAVMQLLDGTRLYVASGTVSFPLEPDLLDRIEILHGPASVLYGDAATGGAVNYVAKQPVSSRLARAGITIGAFETRRAHLDLGGPAGPAVDYRLALSHRSSDTERARNATKGLAGTGSVRWRPSSSWASTLSFDISRQEPQRYFGTPLINGQLDGRLDQENFNVSDSLIRYTDRWLRLVTSWTPSARLNVRHSLHHLTADRRWRNIESYSWTAATGRLARTSPIHILHDLVQTGSRIEGLWRSADGRRSLLAGTDFNRIRFRHTNNAPYAGGDTVDPFALVPGIFASTSPFGPGFSSKTDQHAFFAEGRLALPSAWSLVAGVRRDEVDLDRVDARAAANSFQRSYRFSNGRLGLVWQQSPAGALYAQVSTAADPVGGSLITTAVTQSAFDLAKSRQFEVGYKRRWGQKAETTVAAFGLVKTNLLSRDPLNPALTQQIGEQSSRGLEGTALWRPVPTVQISGNAAWVDASFDRFLEVVAGLPVDRRGLRPVNVPRVTANAEVTWTFLPRWEAATMIRHVAERFVDSANTLRVPSYTVTDLRLRWRYSDTTMITTRIFNVLDERYATTTGNAGRQWLLGPPRTLEIGLDLHR